MLVTIKFVSLILGAYLLGAVPAAYLVAKWWRGIDIRQYGSGNIGATNLLKLASKRIAIPVIIFDLGKGMLAIYVAQLMGLPIYQQVIIGLAAIIGHDWSVFLGFNGGRGLLTTLGVVLILPVMNNLVPWGIAVFLAIAAIGLFIFHSIPVGTGTGIAALPLVSWGLGEPVPLTLGYLAMFLLLITRRLVGQPTVGAPINRKQLLVNRLLFDRDIRDRKAWINRILSQQQKKQEKG